VPTRPGDWVTTSHDVCSQVLRDRRTVVRPEGSTPDADAFGLSVLEMNPPDHTRLRRPVAPAFSPKQIAGYRPRIEHAVHRLPDDAERQGSFGLVSTFAAPDLCADPGWRAVTEEVLRYDPPVQLAARLALEPMEVAGQAVWRGQVVLTVIGAANRDPLVTATPPSSTSTAHRPSSTWRSPAASTTASASRWPGWRPRSRSPRWPSDCRTLRRAGRVVRRNASTIRGPLRLPLSAS
jgi:cytochrome P450